MGRIFLALLSCRFGRSQKMTFQYEADFEEAFIKVLFNQGWEKKWLHIQQKKTCWVIEPKFYFDNNRGIVRLNIYALTEGEMQQILIMN